MANIQTQINLAKSLPIRLQKFFAMNPPRLSVSSTSPQLSNRNPVGEPVAVAPDVEVNSAPSTSTRPFLNPFLPHKHPKTGRWHPPIYSLRRQAELVKLAHEYGVDDLLPYSPKKPEERLRRRQEQGLKVKGTGVGQRVKGKLWERTLKGRLEKRRQAMLEMPALVQNWRTRGHGRGWTKWPS